MKVTVWLTRDGDQEISLEYLDRYVSQDDEGGIAVCESGDNGTYPGLIERQFDSGEWARYEVEA